MLMYVSSSCLAKITSIETWYVLKGTQTHVSGTCVTCKLAMLFFGSIFTRINEFNHWLQSQVEKYSCPDRDIVTCTHIWKNNCANPITILQKPKKTRSMMSRSMFQKNCNWLTIHKHLYTLTMNRVEQENKIMLMHELFITCHYHVLTHVQTLV